MLSNSQRPTDQTRTYDRASSVVFLKTRELFGGLSNMAGGFPLHVQGTRIYTSEALYQACRFPHLPEVQRLIIGQASPMTAKMKSKPHRKESRPDWDRVRVKVMRWCLRVKLAQNWEKFSELLLRTGDRQIVEESRKDDFWGAKPVEDGTLVGINVLGRLLMELREAVKSQASSAFRVVEPPNIPEFLLFGRPIQAIGEHNRVPQKTESESPVRTPEIRVAQEWAGQVSLFGAPTSGEAASRPHAVVRAPEGPLGDVKLYPTMMDSGVPWLGEVPTHWAVKPGRACFREKAVPNTGLVETTVLSLSYGRIVVKPADRLHGLVPASFETYQIVEPGDIVVRPTDLQNDWNSLRFGLSRDRGIITSAYICFRTAPDVTRAYGHLLLHTYDLMKVFYGLGSGLRQNLDWSDFKYLPCLVPPASEQSAIVRFLDHADRRIRRYIRAKQKLIELLDEQKQAIIHHAVTLGLDPNVSLKRSGVDWLGQVPDHWVVASLRLRYHQCLGKMVDAKQRTGKHLVPYLRNVDVQWDRINTVDLPQIDIAPKEYDRYTVRVGDLLVCEGRHLGRAAFWRGELAVCAFQKALHRLRPLDRASDAPRWLFYCLYVVHFLDAFGASSDDNSIPHLTGEMLRAHKFPFPPLEEQEAIANYLDEKVQALELARAAIHSEIQCVREYRTRLIADVVTGKLDVREAAARLPEYVDEPEPSAVDDGKLDADEVADGLGAAPDEAEA